MKKEEEEIGKMRVQLKCQSVQLPSRVVKHEGCLQHPFDVINVLFKKRNLKKK